MKKLISVILALMFLVPAVALGNPGAPPAMVPCVVVSADAPGAVAGEKYKEAPIFIGGTNTPEGLFQIRVYFNPNAGNFTLFLVNPKGGHCVLMVGDGAAIEYEAPKGDPS